MFKEKNNEGKIKCKYPLIEKLIMTIKEIIEMNDMDSLNMGSC